MNKTTNKHWVEEIIDGVPEGMRHVTAVRFVGWLYSRDLTAEEVGFLLQQWNERNMPPLGKQELMSIFQSTKKWELPWAGVKNG